MEINNNNLNQNENQNETDVQTEAVSSEEASAPEVNTSEVEACANEKTQAETSGSVPSYADVNPYFNRMTGGQNPSAPTPYLSSESQMWDYSTQNKIDKAEAKKEGRKNARAFAAVMSVVFGGTILLLILSIAFGGILYKDEKVVYKDRIIYVREDGTISGSLSVPEVYDKMVVSTVEVNVTKDNATGSGTGIIMTADGYIITNAHVVEGAKKISVKLHDESEYDATLCGADNLADLAVIKIKPGATELVPAKFGKSSDLVVGEGVVAIGCPAGHFLTATNGIISAPARIIEVYAEGGYIEKNMLVLQTSTPLNPGNSGGPLINMDGEVIGINTMKLTVSSDGTPYEGLGYVIPIDEAMVLIEKLKVGEQTYGEGIATKTMRLGITGAIVEKGADDGVGGRYPEGGVLVADVEAGTNADTYLKVGDIIMSFNGQKITEFDPFSKHIQGMKEGETLSLEVYRNGEVITVEIPMSILK